MAIDAVRGSRTSLALSLDKIKLEVKAELDDVLKAQGPKARLRHGLRQVAALVIDANPKQQLRCFVHIISALLHHEKFGGLAPNQIERLAKVAHSLLQEQGIEYGRSKLSVLHADLYVALGQVSRRDGQHWLAAWDQLLADQFTRSARSEPTTVQLLASANRLLRLGHADLALTAYRELEAQQPHASVFEKTRVGQAKALRLSGQLALAKELVTSTLGGSATTPQLQQEMTWEGFCIEAQMQLDLDPMLRAVRRRGSHARPGFVAEARLWAMAAPGSWLSDLPPLSEALREKSFKQTHLGLALTCLRCLDECRNGSLPFADRLHRLGMALAKAHQIVALDRHQLFLVGAARWLASVRSQTLAALVLREYTSISLRLTDGRTKDALGQAGDLLQRPWFTGDPEHDVAV